MPPKSLRRGCTRLGIGLALIGLVCETRLHAAALPPRAWSPEITQALEAYRAADYDAAQQTCARLLEGPGEGPWRTDAAAIGAMCLLHQPGRVERVEGRARLQQLVLQDPTLEDEPECLLALGIAQSALRETASALEALEQAAGGFSASGPPGRLAATLVALAQAWARHGEWEMTPPRFGPRRPQTAAEAETFRRQQIEALRARIEALREPAEPRAQLDLILARHLIESTASLAEGYGILSRLAAADTWTFANAEAAAQLAEHYEGVSQYADALPLYTRLQKDQRGPLGQRAEQRIQDITRPQINVQMPDSVPTGVTIPLRVKVRGLSAVQVEVRLVDVNAWLAVAAARSSEAFLPETGSVRVTRQLNTRVPVPYGWWDSDRWPAPLDFTAPGGAYAVIVKGEADDGRVVAVKRLLTVSDLAAVCLVGPQDAVLWVAALDDGAAHRGGRTPTAQFWMNRSFAPTPVVLTDGIARFALPNEARVMRDKGWVCLARAGDDVALCRGVLPHNAPGEVALRTAMIAGPAEARAGDSLFVAGLLLPHPGGELRLPDNPTVELCVVDAIETVQERIQTALTAAGAFAAVVPIPEALAGKHLRVVPRFRGRTAENILGRPAVRVAPLDAGDLCVEIEPDPHAKSVNSVRGIVRAEYPSGRVLRQARVTCQFRAVAPVPRGGADEPPYVPGVARTGQLDEKGQWRFDVPLDEIPRPAGSDAILASANVMSWEGRQTPAHLRFALPVDSPSTGAADERRLAGTDPPGGGDPNIETVRCVAAFTHEGAQTAVRVQLAGESARPLLVVLVGLDPLAARGLPGLTGHCELSLTLDVAPPANPRVWVICASTGGAALLCDVPVTPDPQQAVALRLTIAGADIWPGSTVPVRVDCRTPTGGATLTARLVPAVEVGAHEQASFSQSLTGAPGARPTIATSLGELAAAPAPVARPEGRAPRAAADASWTAWTAGSTLWCWSGAAPEGSMELNVPVPPIPDDYRLLAVVRTSNGGVVAATAPLDARHGLQMSLDVPERFTLGDRARVAVRIGSAAARSVEATLRVAWDSGLAPEQWQIVGAASPPESRAATDALHHNVPAGGQVVAYVEIEAARVGVGRVRCELAAPGRAQTQISRSYEVSPADEPAARSLSLVIQRALFRCAPPGGAERPAISVRPENEELLVAEATLLPGHCVHVQEEFTLTEPQPALSWVQPVPPTCRALAGNLTPPAQIGRRMPDRPGQIAFELRALEPGTYSLDYYLVALRPGACVLPAPQARIRGVEYAVRVEPSETRLRVLDTE